MDVFIESEEKWEVNSILLHFFGMLYFKFCHMVYIFLNFQLLSKNV